MTKISGNSEFSDFVGQYVTINDNGVLRKYFVKTISKDTIARNASYLVPGDYQILGESDTQKCDMCESACIQNIPVLKIHFTNNLSDDYLTKGYADERWEIFINKTSIGTYETSSFQGYANEIWFLPHSSNIAISTDYVNEHCISIPPDVFSKKNLPLSVFNINDWNSIEILPITANNPSSIVINDPDIFYKYPESQLHIHKLFATDTLSVSTLSCAGWKMWDFYEPFHGQGSSIPHSPFQKQNQLSHSFHQSLSAYFIYLNPCEQPFINYYTVDPTKYYAYNESRGAYQYAYDYEIGNDGSPIPPVLRKYVFYSSCDATSDVELYFGYDRLGYFDTVFDNPIFYSDLGVTMFTGTAFDVELVSLYKKKLIIDGYITEHEEYC